MGARPHAYKYQITTANVHHLPHTLTWISISLRRLMASWWSKQKKNTSWQWEITLFHLSTPTLLLLSFPPFLHLPVGLLPKCAHWFDLWGPRGHCLDSAHLWILVVALRNLIIGYVHEPHLRFLVPELCTEDLEHREQVGRVSTAVNNTL